MSDYLDGYDAELARVLEAMRADAEAGGGLVGFEYVREPDS